MKREEFEKNLGKMVEITLFDKRIIKGCLRKSHDELFKDNFNLFYPQKCYFVTENKESKNCISSLFKSSHVIKLKLLDAQCKEVAELQKSPWIPVTERLPRIYASFGDMSLKVLLCDGLGEIYAGRYEKHIDDKKWILDESGIEIRGIVAWMPLPDPYTESVES